MVDEEGVRFVGEEDCARVVCLGEVGGNLCLGLAEAKTKQTRRPLLQHWSIPQRSLALQIAENCPAFAIGES